MKRKPKGKECPPHDFYVKRTVVKNGRTYIFYACTRCTKTYMDIK